MSIPTAQIDQTHRTLPGNQGSLWTLPFRVLPGWVLGAFAIVGLYYARQLWTTYQLYLKAERYKLERRRKAGIPDDDRRDFRLAAADVLRRRKDEDEQRERDLAMKRRAARLKNGGDWERMGEANGLRNRSNQHALGESFGLPDVRYPSLGPSSTAPPTQANFEFGRSQESATASGYGDSEDERQELVLREKFVRRARGEGFGDEPILPRSTTLSASNSEATPSLFAHPSSKRSQTASSDVSRTDASDDGSKRLKVKQEPMSDDVDLSAVPADVAPHGRTRKRGESESGDEQETDEEEDELMSSGSERLVRRPPPAKTARKKQRRRQSVSSAGSEDEDASDAEMGSSSETEDRSADGEDELMSGASRSPSPPPRPLRKQHKRVISEVGSVTSARPRSSLAKKRRKSSFGVAPIASEDEDDAASKAGEVKAEPLENWEDPNGIKFRTGVDGRGNERLVLVKKQVRKFDMPADSEHPDRHQTIAATVERWVNEKEFAELKEQRALAWQSDEEDDNGSPKALEQVNQNVVDGINTVLFNSSSLGRSAARKANLYQPKNPSATPLRPSQSLSHLHELYTSSGLFSTTFPRPASPSSSTGTPVKAGNKLRFSSTASRVRGSPYGAAGKTSLARQAKEAEEQKRLDEELAKKHEEEKKAAVEAPKPAPTPASAPVAPVAAPAPSTRTPAAPATPAAPTAFSFSAPKKDTLSTSTPPAAPAAKSPAAVPNFFASSAPASASSSTPTATSAATSNPFAAKPATSTPAPSVEAAPKPSTPSAGGFSFGAPSKPADSAPLSAPAPAAPKASFSFGAPTSSSPAPAADKPDEAAAQKPAASFSIGAPKAASTPPAGTFGGPSTSTADSAHAQPAKSGFNFGAPPVTSSPTPAPAANPFAFGSSTPKADAPPAEPVKTQSFSFGSSAAPAAASNPTLSSKPSFSFGAAASSTTPAAASPAAPSLSSKPSFSFGAPSSSTMPASASAAPATTPSTPSFSFGGAAASQAPTFGAPAVSAAQSFGGSSTSTPAFGTGSTSSPAFGASTSTSAPKATFSFGAPSAAGAAPAAPAFGGSTPSTAAAPSTFSFGAKPADGSAPAAPKPTFSFGGTGGGAGGFSFGK